ncbi:MAG TPA: hypothetical protein VEF90_17840 [Xanthobacteraceae bacterium]|nr:hypothetical protein [Xanthobacteraceae bacterium]
MAAMLTFDGTINLGQIVEILGFGGAAVVAMVKMVKASGKVREDVQAINKRLDIVDVALQEQTKILVRLGEQSARLTNLETQVGRLSEHIMSAAR